MFSNLAIDVVLGLIFVYLLYSLLASVVQELFARIFHSRARLLTKGLRRMLEEEDHSADLGWFGRIVTESGHTLLVLRSAANEQQGPRVNEYENIYCHLEQ